MAEPLKFLVIVEGANCTGLVLHDAEGRPGTLPAGFFTTRFVEALDPAEAGRSALEVVRHEIVAMGATCSLAVSEVRRDDRAYDLHAPGRGFTWF